MFVIPIGRHTLLEPVGIDEDDEREVPAFVRALGDWFERIERLERHADLVVSSNLHQLGARLSIREIALALYLERLPMSLESLQTSVLDLGRKFDVPPYLLFDAVRTIK